MPENLFVGTWKLISCNAYRRNGQILAIYGAEPVGRLFYDCAGNMSVHLMRAGRTKCTHGDKFRASDEEMRAAYEGYEAYFSTYEIDDARCMIHHRVDGGLFPNWTGSVQSRFYKFEGRDRLVLSTEPIDAPPAKRTVITLMWQRLA